MSDRLKVSDKVYVGRSQPSAEEIDRLAADGFAAIVDLRQEGEGNQTLPPPLEAATAGRNGLRYMHLGMPTDRLDDEMLDRFRRVIDRLPGPVFVHCGSGKRSGTFAIAHAALTERLAGDAALARIEDAGVGYGSGEMRALLRRYIDRCVESGRDRGRPAPVASGASLARALPATTRRVEKNTPDAINRRIARQIEESVHWYAAHPREIGLRLEQLDREWDMERTLEANAAGVALGGLLLGVFANRRFLLVPAAVAAFLMQHALQGWCPPVPFFRRLGVRTASEIERERTALKALRGDFVGVGESGRERRAQEAVAASRA